MSLSQTDLYNAATNTGHGTFTLGDREFEIKDLEYDDYLLFCRKAQPIIMAVTGCINTTAEDGRIGVKFNAMGLDFPKLLELAGDELVKMAWICCKQSEPAITERQVKKLAKRPMALLEVVIIQIKQNNLVQEFVDFFQRVSGRMAELLPAAQEAMQPVDHASPEAPITE